jgi:hypothetical protein
VLANRRWTACDVPFPHFVARGVFKEEFYRALAGAFRDILARGLDDGAGDLRFTRARRGYDAYGLSFPADLAGPLRIFISRPWHDMLADLTGVRATGHVNSGLHHHVAGSGDGFVHNDLNPGWFVDEPNDDGVIVADHDACDYISGEVRQPGVTPRVVVRAAAMLFYLCNPPWSPGDGGSTGLYRNQRDPVGRPAAVVPPLNNSILVFECTPFSYHTFLSNRRHPRNCAIMWVHRPLEDAVDRWGAEAIVHWK